MVVRELVTRLGFTADTAQANRYENAIRNIRRVALATTAAVTAIGGAAASVANSTAQAATETLQWANRLGLTTEQLSRLQFAASQYGVQQDAVIDGLKELSLRTDEFVKTGKGPGVDAFNALGLEASELNAVSNDTAELFALVRSRVDDIQNAAERQRIVDELFGGQAGEQFAEFLSINTQEFERLQRLADELGVTIGGSLAQDSRAYTRQIGRLQAVFTGLRNTVGGELLPALSDFLMQMQAFILRNRELITQRIQSVLQGIGFALRSVGLIIGGVLKTLDRIVNAFADWESVIRLTVSALLLMTGLKVARWLTALAIGLKVATASLFTMRGALVAIQRIPIVAAFTALAFAIEDIIVWILGGQSVIGRFIGSWDDFKAKVSEVKDQLGIDVDVMKQQLRGLADTLIGALTFDKDRILQGLRNLFVPFYNSGKELGRRLVEGLKDMMPDWLSDALSMPDNEAAQMTGDPRRQRINQQAEQVRRNMAGAANPQSSVNVNANVSLQVPEGTNQEQRAALQSEARQLFNSEFDRIIRQSMIDFQPVE